MCVLYVLKRFDFFILILMVFKYEYSENCGEIDYFWCNCLIENIISKDCSRLLRLFLL